MSAMGLGDMLYDSKAQPGATEFSAARFIDAVKPLK
jgi:hypothetical protein